jgi:hypothetical protein
LSKDIVSEQKELNNIVDNSNILKLINKNSFVNEDNLKNISNIQKIDRLSLSDISNKTITEKLLSIYDTISSRNDLITSLELNSKNFINNKQFKNSITFETERKLLSNLESIDNIVKSLNTQNIDSSVISTNRLNNLSEIDRVEKSISMTQDLVSLVKNDIGESFTIDRIVNDIQNMKNQVIEDSNERNNSFNKSIDSILLSNKIYQNIDNVDIKPTSKGNIFNNSSNIYNTNQNYPNNSDKILNLPDSYFSILNSQYLVDSGDIIPKNPMEVLKNDSPSILDKISTISLMDYKSVEDSKNIDKYISNTNNSNFLNLVFGKKTSEFLKNKENFKDISTEKINITELSNQKNIETNKNISDLNKDIQMKNIKNIELINKNNSESSLIEINKFLDEKMLNESNINYKLVELDNLKDSIKTVDNIVTLKQIENLKTSQQSNVVMSMIDSKQFRTIISSLEKNSELLTQTAVNNTRNISSLENSPKNNQPVINFQQNNTTSSIKDKSQEQLYEIMKSIDEKLTLMVKSLNNINTTMYQTNDNFTLRDYDY